MLELQRKLLGDRVRNAAFFRALQKVIQPGKSIVLDVGSGTGFLSFLAERLGAKECWLVESGDIAVLAETLATHNGMQRCRFVHAHSATVPLPKADVIVSETLGNYALEEGIIDTLNDIRRTLKRGGTLIPHGLRQFVCPVTSARLQKEIDVWNVGYELDLAPARHISLQNMYVKTIKKTDLLNGGKAARIWDDIDFTQHNENVREGTIEWRMPKRTTIHGLALWWEAMLIPGITLSTSPAAKPTHWQQIYLPLLEPITCNAGATLRVALHSDTRPDVGVRVRWTVQEQTLDTDAGLL